MRLRLFAGFQAMALICLFAPKAPLRDCLGFISNRFAAFQRFDT